MSASPEAASGRGSVDDPLARLREAERVARGRLLGHSEIDGEGIRLALEHEWALLDLRAAKAAARRSPAQPPVDPRTRLAG